MWNPFKSWLIFFILSLSKKANAATTSLVAHQSRVNDTTGKHHQQSNFIVGRSIFSEKLKAEVKNVHSNVENHAANHEKDKLLAFPIQEHQSQEYHAPTQNSNAMHHGQARHKIVSVEA